MKIKLTRKQRIITIVIIVGISIGVTFRLLTPTPLIVVSSKPSSYQKHNPFLPLTLTFNRNLNEKEIKIEISPVATYSTSINNNILSITPQIQFEPFTNYTLSLSTQPPFVLQFTTEGDVSNPPGWKELFEQTYTDYEKQYGKQDSALSNIRQSVPIKESGFNIDYSYKNNTYTITLQEPYDTNKQKFISWFVEQGVTDLSTLRLKYVNQ